MTSAKYSLPFLISTIATLAMYVVHCAPYASNNAGPLSTYKSASQIGFLDWQKPPAYMEQRPDIFAPFLNMTLNNEPLVTPGYIFLEPFQTTQPGPYLYDNAGVGPWPLISRN
jgi:hypothetical protein